MSEVALLRVYGLPLRCELRRPLLLNSRCDSVARVFLSVVETVTSCSLGFYCWFLYLDARYLLKHFDNFGWE